MGHTCMPQYLIEVENFLIYSLMSPLNMKAALIKPSHASEAHVWGRYVTLVWATFLMQKSLIINLLRALWLVLNKVLSRAARWNMLEHVDLIF